MWRKESLAGRRALVTGASGGVGRALALRLAEEGVDCVLVARRQAELAETARRVEEAGRRAVPVVGDLCDDGVRGSALDAANSSLGGLDLLVNNAGVGAHGRFTESDPESLRRVFELNFFAVVELTRRAVPLLAEGHGACVANVGSVLGWRGVPQVSAYCASKYALRGFCDSVRPELARLGVRVLHASPSTIDTPFQSNLVEERGPLAWSGRRGVSPERVAERIVSGVQRRQSEVAITWEDWAYVRLTRFAPGVLERVMLRYG